MFARTDRLLLRPGWVEDAPALHRAIGDEGIVCNLATAPWPYRYEDALRFLATERDPGEPSCLIYLRTDGAPELIGSIGIGRRPNGERELGYWIARRHWGRGFATEAGRALIANARQTLRLRRLAAGHFLDNPASGRVLAKLGFTPTGEISACYSSGRKVESPCRMFALDLAEPDDAPAMRAIAA
jgi:RimJ/RimL family protein N-acetyltransferase